ncbi:MAG: hypothetical protein CVV49_18080 [Spirochaetae bacterium HGW-Spirochaetae-5]|nr:MAG: hypothetical protein CVV49_18080 [Spirochaetae bacterium HGW-Spirochaetae-5]
MVDRVRGITRYGYVIKSSGDFVLQSSIEMAFELVAAHKRVKASEEHFYGLFDKAPLGYQSLDEEGHFVEVNEKWLETLGYDRDEVMGKWFGDFLAPEFVEAFRERFPMFKAAGKIHSEFQMMHKCGERRFIAFEGRIGYKTDGSFQQTHCILSDITEQKRAETELYRTKAILQAAMDQSPAGIAIADASDGKLRYVNDAGLLIRGGDRQELVDGVGIDKYVTSWQILDLDGSPLETDKVPLARAVLYGDINSREFIIRRSIGEDRIVLANAAPIRDENGNIEAGMVVFSDITERVLAERDLKNKNEELTALNGKLKIAVEELEATNEELNASMEEMEATNEELYAINELVIEAERKLEISESLFRGLYDSMTSGSAIYTVINDGSRGADYIVKNFNKSGLKIEGKTIEDVVGRSLLDLRPEIDSYGLIPVLKKVWDTGEPDFFPVKIYKDDKFSNYFDNYVFKLPSGEVVTLYNDVTDQKLAEENLRESEEQFRSLAESSTDYIMVYDKDTRHTYANKATLTVSGKTWDEFVGKTHREMGFDPDLVELWEEKIQKVFDTGESQGEIFEWEGAEGKTVLDWRVNPIFAKDGTVSNVLGVSRDISALKQAEESLRKSEERFSRALAAVDDGIWDWNTSDGSAFFNTECYNLLGYSDGEFSASYDSWRTLVHPDDIDRVEEDLKNSIGSGIKFDIDLRMKRKSGEWLWVCTRGKAVEWDSEGRTLRMIGTLSDVTLRKKTEFELRESQNNLTRIIENSSELICEIDDTGRYTFVSKRYEDILGYSPDELLGQLVSEKMHPDDLTAAAAKHETVKSEKGISVDEWRFSRWMRLSCFLL